jgi:hypothetical protein
MLQQVVAKARHAAILLRAPTGQEPSVEDAVQFAQQRTLAASARVFQTVLSG